MAKAKGKPIRNWRKVDAKAKTILPEPPKYFDKAEFHAAVSKEAVKGPTKTREELNGAQWTGHYGVKADDSRKREDRKLAKAKPVLPASWQDLPKPTATHSVSGEHTRAVLERLFRGYKEGRLMMKEIAEAGKCTSPSASCWFRGISSPTDDKLPALEALLAKVGY